MVYVALLRGINVGGNNKVEMKKLKSTFESLGFQNVQTYINTGNIIFTDTTHSPATIVSLLEKAITKDFGLEIRVLLCDLKSIQKIISKLPESWVNDKDMKCDVMFLWEEVDSPKILSELTIKDGIDEVHYVSGAIIWKVNRKDVTKSGMVKLVGTKTYKLMTIRNCNTVRKLAKLMEDSEK